MIPNLSTGWILDLSYMTNSALDTELDEYLTKLKHELSRLIRSDESSLQADSRALDGR
jgi:hypothetical protein